MKSSLLPNSVRIYTVCVISITCLLSLMALSDPGYAAEVSTVWDANSEDDLAGYRLYYKNGSSGAPYDGAGLNEGNSPITLYLEDLDDPDSPEFTLTGLEKGKLYFLALTAFDTEGVESLYSDEIAYGEEVTDDEEGVENWEDEEDESGWEDKEDGEDGGDDEDEGSLENETGGWGVEDEVGVEDGEDVEREEDVEDEEGWEDEKGSSDTTEGDTSDLSDAGGNEDEGPSNEEILDDLPMDTPTDGGQAPAPPVPVYDNVEVAPLGPVELAVAGFEGSIEGDNHLQTEWRIFRAEDDACALSVVSTSFLTAFRIPDIFLDENTEYYWRARFFDQNKETSEWSTPAKFTTGFSGKDTDGNGIPESQEVDLSVDMNRDGLPDAEQEITKAISLPLSDQSIGLGIGDSDTGMAILFLEAVDADDLEISESSKRRAQELPYGLLNFKLAVAESGDATTVKVYFPESVPQNAKWIKLDLFSGLWIDFSEHVRFSEDRMSMELELVDGGPGDDDGVANSITIDPAGLEFSASESAAEQESADDSEAGDSGGGGCFIAGILGER